MSATLEEGPQQTPLDGAPAAGDQVPNATDVQNHAIDPEALFPRVVNWYKVNRDHSQKWRQEATECYDFRAGHQWTDEDLQVLQDQTRPAITFNRIGPFVDAVGGLEINNRQETRYAPRQVGVQVTGTTDLLTSAAQWARQESDAEDEETEAFLDVVTCGVGCLQTRMDYDNDPDGMIVVDRIDPLEMYPDAASRKQNFSDAKNVVRCKDIPLDEAIAMFPHEPEQDLHAQWAEDQADAASEPHNARIAPYYRIDQSGDIDRNTQMVRMVEVEWWQYEPAYRVLDPASGRFVLLDPMKATVFQFRARALGYKATMKKDRRKVYHKAIVGARVLKIMEGADKGGFFYKFITGKRDSTKGTWYGLVRAMRDPQMWANKWLSQGLHIVNVNAKGGLLAETDAFADIEEARDDWASADSITELNPGGLAKIQQKNPPEFPQQINQMSQMAIDAIPMVSGINMELMGQTTSTAPQVAMVEVGRKQQGMNVLAALFNAKRRYQKEQGRLLLWMIQTFIADGRLIRVGGPEQAQYVPLIHEPGLAEYDVIVEDAPTSPNMKERVWAALMQLFPMLRGMAIPPQFYLNALKYAPIPASFATESQQILSQPPPPNPDAQGKEAVAQSQVLKNQAGAMELVSKAQRTQAESQAMPQNMNLEVEQKKATIEKTKADAINALQNAGIIEDDQRFGQTMKAIEALLSVHGATLQHVDQMHQHRMDMAKHDLASQAQQASQQQAAQEAAQQETGDNSA